MRTLTPAEMAWIAGGYDSVDEITVTPPEDEDWDWGEFFEWSEPQYDPADEEAFICAPSGPKAGLAPVTASDIAEILKIMKDIDWNKVAININEARLNTYLKGYNGELIVEGDLRIEDSMTGTRGTVAVHSEESDTLGGGRHYYADRDGDGEIDAGLLINKETGTVSLDWDMDGKGDAILTKVP
ncbi:hypothetical protein [Caulobacter endophyticus]|uniref:hypothetical protein n=1 Tax=Caulobacter endophyticus TaxID=2172652 RepID=UPI0024101B4C|nr:hypothetical protein [Caulobacter endophyticus]MDG2530682.1 hypothetical protein [Caulobacter endophyticus]